MSIYLCVFLDMLTDEKRDWFSDQSLLYDYETFIGQYELYNHLYKHMFCVVFCRLLVYNGIYKNW